MIMNNIFHLTFALAAAALMSSPVAVTGLHLEPRLRGAVLVAVSDEDDYDNGYQMGQQQATYFWTNKFNSDCNRISSYDTMIGNYIRDNYNYNNYGQQQSNQWYKSLLSASFTVAKLLLCSMLNAHSTILSLLVHPSLLQLFFAFFFGQAWNTRIKRWKEKIRRQLTNELFSFQKYVLTKIGFSQICWYMACRLAASTTLGHHTIRIEHSPHRPHPDLEIR